MSDRPDLQRDIDTLKRLTDELEHCEDALRAQLGDDPDDETGGEPAPHR